MKEEPWHSIDMMPVDHPLLFLPSGYLRMDVLDWLSQNIGEPDVINRYNHVASSKNAWQYWCPSSTKSDRGASDRYQHVISFAKKSDAMWFKLVWFGK